MLRRVLLAVAFAATLGACDTIKYEPPYEVNAVPIPASLQRLPLERLETVIANGAMREGNRWVFVRSAPGVLDGRLDLRTHQVVVKVLVQPQDYSIRYGHAVNIKQSGGMIDRRVNVWLRALDRDIRIALAREQNI